MTKGLWVYCLSPLFHLMFSKSTFLYFYILSHPFSFWNNFPHPPLLTHNMASVSTFESAFLSQYHVSCSSVVSDFSLTNCQYILLFFHSSYFSLIRLCLNSFLFNVSLYSIVSAAFMPSINHSSEFLTYHPKLFSSIPIHPSQLEIYLVNITFQL